MISKSNENVMSDFGKNILTSNKEQFLNIFASFYPILTLILYRYFFQDYFEFFFFLQKFLKFSLFVFQEKFLTSNGTKVIFWKIDRETRLQIFFKIKTSSSILKTVGYKR